MSTPPGKPRPKAYLSIGEYLRKAGAFKTVNVYYNDIISTHPSVAQSDNGDDEDVDELAQGMIEAAQHGHLETLKFLAAEAQTGGEEGGLGTCIGERVTSLMLHLAAEFGHAAIVHYLVEDLWVDVDAGTARGMTALHYAAKANRAAVVRELYQLGADLEARNDAGQVPAQLTKDRLLRRLFQQYLGGGAWGSSAPLVDRFVSPSASRVIDYVAVMTVKMAPQLMEESDKLSNVKQASVADIWRYPLEDHEDTPMTDASNLAEICTQACETEGGPSSPYGTLLTDSSGARSFVWSKVLGVYQDAAQRGRARVHTALGPPKASSTTAGETTATVVFVLARHPYTSAFAAICEHIGELIWEEVPKWGSLAEWPLDMEHERNAQIKFCLEHYATDLPLPLPSREAKQEVLGRELRYGDAHASHSSFPHLEESDLRCLTSKLGPDAILAALTCLLQEQSVLLLSDHIENLAPATSALLGLLFPLRWPHTLIPVLPGSLVHYLEAPVPFLMGMRQQELEKVGADLSCVTIVNLATSKVVLPIRPITSLSTVIVADSTGREPQRRPSGRRDSVSRALQELPTAIKRRAESRIRRCVPLEIAPASDRVHHQPRASTLYTPGLRVAVADIMVELFGAYQNYRYVPGSQNRMVSEAPEDHRKLLEAIFSTHLWHMFREDLLAEEAGVNGESWEEQVQLFCACVEKARHRRDPAATVGESHSCQEVLYPSEDIEEQLSLMSVYPEPESITDESIDDDGGAPLPGTIHIPSPISISPNRNGKTQATVSPARSHNSATTSGGRGGGVDSTPSNLQEKTDEVLRSITSSFATVTDMFGSKDTLSPAPSADKSGGDAEKMAESQDRPSEGSSGGWDMFKPPSMAEMKKKLDGMKAAGLSPRRESEPSAHGREEARRKVSGHSLSPARQGQDGGGFAMIGDSWRDLRRRSTEAMNEAVTKLKSALDDSDDESDFGADHGDSGRAKLAGAVSAPSGVSARPGSAAKAKPSIGRKADDAFWKPFGDEGGDVDDDGGNEPVPLPSAEEVRRIRKDKDTTASARKELHAYYGGGI